MQNTRPAEPMDDHAGEARYVVLALVAGALTGLVGSVFHMSIDRLIVWPRWLSGIADGWWLVGIAAAVTMLATVLAVFIVRHVAPEAGGSGVQEIEGAMEGLRSVRWARVLPVKFFAGLIAMASGLVLGREGPTIHMGASLAQAVSGAARVNELERRGLLAAGAAAGLACAFNAPLSGVLFVIEETHKEFPYTFRTYLGVASAAIASTIVTQLIGGTAADMPLAAAGVPLAALPAFLVLGAILAVTGTLLNAALLRMMDVAAAIQRRMPYLYPALVGLAVGALLILMPQAVTGGEGVVMELAAASPGLAALLGLGALRFATMVGSYSSGVPGGIFAPILALAACIGFAFAGVAERSAPVLGRWIEVPPLACAICAMGGLFTASVRAPIVGAALAMELTGSYALLLPLMVTCVSADLFAQWSGGRPIYTQLLERTLAAAGNSPRAVSDDPTGLA